jgi:hypothetical protein
MRQRKSCWRAVDRSQALMACKTKCLGQGLDDPQGLGSLVFILGQHRLEMDLQLESYTDLQSPNTMSNKATGSPCAPVAI